MSNGVPAEQVRPGLWVVKKPNPDIIDGPIDWSKPMIAPDTNTLEALKQTFLFAIKKIKTGVEWDELRESVKINGVLPSWWNEVVITSGLFEKLCERLDKGNTKPKWRSLFDEET